MKKWFISSAIALSLFSVAASASAYSSSGQGFARAWTLTDSGGTGSATWEVEYGFNKFAIDEDFIHGYHNSKGHTSKLTNATNTFSNSDTAGNWSGIDVVHNGSLVYYNFNF
ncbi:hypothetical protein D3C74_224880 [compost metagenome]